MAYDFLHSHEHQFDLLDAELAWQLPVIALELRWWLDTRAKPSFKGRPSMYGHIHRVLTNEGNRRFEIEAKKISDLFDKGVAEDINNVSNSVMTAEDIEPGTLSDAYWWNYSRAQASEQHLDRYHYKTMFPLAERNRFRFRHLLGDRTYQLPIPPLRLRFVLDLSKLNKNA
jgi:hypothetical protein